MRAARRAAPAHRGRRGCAALRLWPPTRCKRTACLAACCLGAARGRVRDGRGRGDPGRRARPPCSKARVCAAYGGSMARARDRRAPRAARSGGRACTCRAGCSAGRVAPCCTWACWAAWWRRSLQCRVAGRICGTSAPWSNARAAALRRGPWRARDSSRLGRATGRLLHSTSLRGGTRERATAADALRRWRSHSRPLGCALRRVPIPHSDARASSHPQRPSVRVPGADHNAVAGPPGGPDRGCGAMRAYGLRRLAPGGGRRAAPSQHAALR